MRVIEISGVLVICLAAGACAPRVFNNSAETEATTGGSAYVCNLYDKAANVPGGDIPALILYSNTSNADAAKKACSARVDKTHYIDYQLLWIEPTKLPANWQKSDLLAGIAAGSTTTAATSASAAVSGATTTTTTGDNGVDAYACDLYDTPTGNTPKITLYAATSNSKAAEAACRAKVDKKPYVDFGLRWMKRSDLPANWGAQKLL